MREHQFTGILSMPNGSHPTGEKQPLSLFRVFTHRKVIGLDLIAEVAQSDQSEGFPAASCGVTIFPRPLRVRGDKVPFRRYPAACSGEVHYGSAIFSVFSVCSNESRLCGTSGREIEPFAFRVASSAVPTPGPRPQTTALRP